MARELARDKAGLGWASGNPLPGPRGLPWIGNLWGVTRKGLFGMVEECWKRYGDAFRLQLGPKTANVFLHPEAIKHVYVTYRDNYRKEASYDGIRLLVGNGLLTLQDKAWHERRRVMQPSFHKASIYTMMSQMAEATEQMLGRWDQTFADGQSIDLYPELMRVTLEIIGKTLFSLDLGIQAHHSAEAFTVALEAISARGNKMFQLPLSIRTPSNVRFEKALASLNALVYDVIETRRREGSAQPDLLTMLLETRDEAGEGLTTEELRDEIMTMFLAGHETTAIALSWCYMLLAQHPHIVEQLEEEWDRVLGGRAPTMDDLPALEMTRKVFQESMRLYPSTWSGARDAVADDTIMGYQVKGGSMIMICPLLTHRHPDFWEDPERFDPERFSPENSKDRHKHAYLPFSTGPRMCIGNHFSTIEAQLILATVGQRYRFRLDPAHRIERDFQITLRPKHGIHMFINRR